MKKALTARITKVFGRKFGQKAKGKGDDFNIDLASLATEVTKKGQAEPEKKQPVKTTNGKPNGKPNGKKAAKKEKPAKAAKKEKPAKAAKKNGDAKRGHPAKGALKPIATRPWFNPDAVFETVEESKGVIGKVTGHLPKTWKVKDATSVVKTLLAKKDLPKMYSKWGNAAAIARWVARRGTKDGLLKVVKNPLPKE